MGLWKIILSSKEEGREGDILVEVRASIDTMVNGCLLLLLLLLLLL